MLAAGSVLPSISPGSHYSEISPTSAEEEGEGHEVQHDDDPVGARRKKVTS